MMLQELNYITKNNIKHIYSLLLFVIWMPSPFLSNGLHRYAKEKQQKLISFVLCKAVNM